MIIFWLTCLVGYPRTSAPEPKLLIKFQEVQTVKQQLKILIFQPMIHFLLISNTFHAMNGFQIKIPNQNTNGILNVQEANILMSYLSVVVQQPKFLEKNILRI